MFFQDWHANKRNPKGRFILTFFRLVSYLKRSKILTFLGLPVIILYKLLVDWVMSVDIPLRTQIGKNCVLYHGQGLVINAFSVIGKNCILRHTTTIGNKLSSNGQDLGSPTIGDCCEIGAHVVIIGPITIGHNVIVGAGTVVTKDIPSNSVAYGSPMKIKKRD